MNTRQQKKTWVQGYTAIRPSHTERSDVGCFPFLRGCFKVQSPLNDQRGRFCRCRAAVLAVSAQRALDGASKKGTRLVGRHRSRRERLCGPRGSVSPPEPPTHHHASPVRAPLLNPLLAYDQSGILWPWQCSPRPPVDLRRVFARRCMRVPTLRHARPGRATRRRAHLTLPVRSKRATT